MHALRRILLLALLTGCSEPLGRFPTGPGPTPDPDWAGAYLSTLTQSSLAADALVAIARQTVVIPLPGGSVTLGYRDGFYLVRTVMLGSQRELLLQLQDASGRPMQVYNPVRTHALRLITTTEDPAGLRHFDLIVRGVEVASDEFRVQGRGHFSTGPRVWLFSVDHLTLAKLGTAFPLRGEILLETDHESEASTAVRLRFNGSRLADGTLESGDVTIYFTLDLISLELSPREPPS